MARTVVIDCFAASAEKYGKGCAVVAVDVIRATTTLLTALSLGRRIYPARSTDEAAAMARLLDKPLLVGELGGNVPYGYDLTNSPVLVTALSTVNGGAFTAPERPIILTSSSGVPLLLDAKNSDATYAGCLRNYSAMAEHLARHHDRVALIGAGTRGEFRREDQLGCAWIAEKLLAAGFEAEDDKTRALVDRWHNSDLQPIREGKSADYLRRSGQVFDLEFVLSNIDDLKLVPIFKGGAMVDVNAS
ncbi:MAG: 2-phosphosulfolactate phosphatase [Polyangiaceae bacterium]|nr:2-phosphosulfolactate phosphatase [Polyangiaceae bacterium]